MNARDPGTNPDRADRLIAALGPASRPELDRALDVLAFILERLADADAPGLDAIDPGQPYSSKRTIGDHLDGR